MKSRPQFSIREIEMQMSIDDALMIECRETNNGNIVNIKQLNNGVFYIRIASPIQQPEPDYIEAGITTYVSPPRRTLKQINKELGFVGGAL